MGSFSIWHWLIVLLVLAGVAGAAVWSFRQRGSTASSPGMYVYRDPLPLVKVIRVLLWAEITVAAIAIVAGAFQQRVLGQIEQDLFPSYEAMEAAAGGIDVAVALIAIGQFILTLVLGFLILKWIYRSNANARALGAKTMQYTPGWAIGWYFVPVLSLWKPFDAFRETWRISARGAGAAVSTPLLGLWWTLWLVAGIVGQIALRMSLTEDADFEMLRLAAIATQAADVTTIAVDLVFMVLLQQLATMQVAWRGAPQAEVFA